MKFSEYRDTNPEFVEAVLSAKLKKDRKLDQIASAQSRDKKRFLILQFLNDFEIKKYYLFKSVQHKKRLDQFPPAEIENVARGLSAFQPFNEDVTPINLRSGNGRRRTTYSFGPRRHALQKMTADILKVIFPFPYAGHYTIHGGVRAALEAVSGHVSDGFKFAIERDIRQFYPSVNIERLAELLRPLPGSVVRNVLAYRPRSQGLNFSIATSADNNAPLSPRGMLAQGSAASPVAAEIIMADLLMPSLPNVRVVAYADNVLILGETLDAVENANNILEDSANLHPCGPLGLKPPLQSHVVVGGGIEFLGSFGAYDGSSISWEPNDRAMSHLIGTLGNATSDEQIRTTINWMTKWSRGYPLWDRDIAERYRIQLWAKLALNSNGPLSRNFIEAAREIRSYCLLELNKHGQLPDLHDLFPDSSEEWTSGISIRTQIIEHIYIRLGVPPIQQNPTHPL
ncbi:reverse transcriptase domain-containing protein [Brucella sp. C7-11G]